MTVLRQLPRQNERLTPTSSPYSPGVATGARKDVRKEKPRIVSAASVALGATGAADFPCARVREPLARLAQGRRAARGAVKF